MTERFKIPYPVSDAGKKQWNRLYGVNAYWSGKHWAQRKQDADYWHRLTRAALDGKRKRPFEKPVTITFYWNDRLDLDNHSMMAKMIIDALKGRIIADDTRRYVKGIMHYWHNEPYIGVILREVEKDG